MLNPSNVSVISHSPFYRGRNWKDMSVPKGYKDWLASGVESGSEIPADLTLP